MFSLPWRIETTARSKHPSSEAPIATDPKLMFVPLEMAVLIIFEFIVRWVYSMWLSTVEEEGGPPQGSSSVDTRLSLKRFTQF